MLRTFGLRARERRRRTSMHSSRRRGWNQDPRCGLFDMERIKGSKVQADKSLRMKSRGKELEVSGGRLVREEQQRGLSTGAQVVGRGRKKVTELERRGERRERMGPGGKRK